MRLKGGRTGKRAVICEDLELRVASGGDGGSVETTGLMKPFDLEVWYGERVAVLGSNGSGKSHFLRLLARGGTDPDPSTGSGHRPSTGSGHRPSAGSGHRPSTGSGHRPSAGSGQRPPDRAADGAIAPVQHTGVARLGARVRPGWFVQTHEHPELVGRTLLEVLHRGDEHRDGMPREQASRALDRYELAHAAEQRFESLSGGQQARFQILLLELSGVTLLLLDEPTDNLDLASAEALEDGLEAFDGTVLAVTHDRWFSRSFDRYLVFGSDGVVYEAPEPVWDEARVQRAR
jgi:ATPase subunit of ABC transporter with duplicated ATPase domains